MHAEREGDLWVHLRSILRELNAVPGQWLTVQSLRTAAGFRALTFAQQLQIEAALRWAEQAQLLTTRPGDATPTESVSLTELGYRQ